MTTDESMEAPGLFALFSVPWNRDVLRKARSAAPGRQGARSAQGTSPTRASFVGLSAPLRTCAAADGVMSLLVGHHSSFVLHHSPIV